MFSQSLKRLFFGSGRFLAKRQFCSLNPNVNVANVLLKKKFSTGIPQNMGMDHVGLVVPDIEQATKFFEEVFDAEFDWEVKRDPLPTAKERGWDKLFNVHPDSYLKHVVMLKCGNFPLTQYLELFEWVSPDQFKPTGENNWYKFSDLGFFYVSFTVKDLNKVMEHVKQNVIPKWKGVRFIQDPPMNFPLRGEVCNSTFLVTPWGMWIELTCWSISKNKADVIELQQVKETNKYIGQHINNLPTPSLLMDLDKIDHNTALMRARFQEKNVNWRVTSKAFKCPDLTSYIVEKGSAQGIICLTLTECEQFALAGFQDIYLANEVASQEEIVRLSLLAKKIKKLRIAVDNLEYLQQVSAAVKRWEITTPIEVLVEININHNRCGVNSLEEAVELAAAVKELELTQGSVTFVGITGYEGHTAIMEPLKKREETIKSHQILQKAREEIEKTGTKVTVVSAGGSCNYMDSLSLGIVNEIQAGGGAVTDLLYYNKANLKEFGHQMGVSVLTSLISVPGNRSRAMGNAGFKCVGWHPFGGLPEPRDPDSNLKVVGLSAEHTKFEPVLDTVKQKRGDKVVLNTGYSDAMGFLHRTVYAIRKDVVQQVWKTFSGETWH